MKCFVVALEAEAKPLLKHFRLQADSQAQGFRVYRNQTTALIVAASGQVSAAASTAYLQAFLGQPEPHAWLNIGVGGHADAAIGAAFIGHKITDDSSGKSWYPPQIIIPPCPTLSLRTVTHAENNYPTEAIYEMEAAGFYPIACRFASAELVQVCKIISDNRENAANRLTANNLTELIGAQLNVIDDMMTQLDRLAAELAALHVEPPGYTQLLHSGRSSVSERHRLRDNLQRWQTLCPDQTLPQFDDSRTALHWLDQQLAARPYRGM